MKKYIEHLSELTSFRLFIIRYLVNFVMLIEILYLPIVLSSESYVKIELYRNILLFAPIVLLGINSGYLNSFYREKNDLRFSLSILGLFFSVFSMIIYYLWTLDFIFSLAILCFVFILSIEKILVVDGYFILSSIYKALFSIFLLILVTFFKNEAYISSIYSFSIILGTIFWGLILIYKYKLYFILNEFQTIKIFNILNDFFSLLKEGFLISMQSSVLVAFFLFDRWFIFMNYSDNITQYSISFSFSQIVFIALNTIAFSMQKKLGENLSIYNKVDVNRLVKINFLFFILIEVFSILIIYLFIKFNLFTKYDDFLISFVLISFFYGIYFLFSSYNVISLYNGHSKLFLQWILVAFLLNIIISYLFIFLGMSYYSILFKSGILLTVLALYGYRNVQGNLINA